MRRLLGATGRVLITTGILLLLFVAYQLWGTGIYEARAQSKLRNQVQDTLEAHGQTPLGATTTTAPDPSTVSTTPPTTVAPPPITVPANGEGLGFIRIEKIGLGTGDPPEAVVEGVDVDDLRKGPGHYPSTPLPGQEGNAAIAGHRTTYGAPFGDVNNLVKGDTIVVQTVQGTFTYRVDQDPFAVDPNDGDVLLPDPDPTRTGHFLATLTLTTCDPPFSAAQRLIVKASLELPAGAAPLPPSPGTSGSAVRKISGLSGDRSSRLPALLWGIIVAIVGLLWWWLFHRYPRWTSWFVGVVPFVVALFVFYTYLERMLPSNY
jgi:sortase A